MVFIDRDRVKRRLKLSNTQSIDDDGIDELIVDAHAQIIQILRGYDEIDITALEADPTAFTDYLVLYGAETSLCVGLFYHTRPSQNEFIKYTISNPHPSYHQGIEDVHTWAKARIKSQTDDSSIARVVRSPVTSELDFENYRGYGARD